MTTANNAKLQAPNPKSQISSNLQYPNFKFPTLKFANWDLFRIWYLVFGISLCLLLVISGCTKQGGAGVGFSMPPMPVEVARATTQKVMDKFEAVGAVEAIEAITVVSEIDGTIVSLPFEEGSFIKRGG